ncbi:hypothetical protein [Nocardia coubleae]|uniref:Uncharacterized protein n=1 Tax=Nocardia coubleae TaxID=356147 RepID=A0A846W2S3_9NOCA|nr:hypothetical protein [Nocardia coubleae]NKX87502.1 hypothetical protein [Nocardia coubleae]
MPHMFVGGDVFAPVAMTKNGSSAMGSYNQWTTVPAWTADTVGYPSSVVSGNALQVQSATASAQLSAAVVVAGAGTTASFQARLLVNGTVVATGAAVSGTGGTLLVSASVALQVGDLVTVETLHTVQLTSWQATISGGTSTFVRVT